MTARTAPNAAAGSADTPAIHWYATWECGACGAGGDEHFDDGTIVDAGHDCEDEDGAIGWRGAPSAPAAGQGRPISATATTSRPATTARATDDPAL